MASIKRGGKSKEKVPEAMWVSIINWLHLAKLIAVVGIIIFIVSIFTDSQTGELAAYWWLAIGVFATMMMAAIMVSRGSEESGLLAILEKCIPFFVPTVFTLTPIILLIIIFQTVGGIVSRDPVLPPAFEKFNYMTFLFVIIQTVLLNQFYVGEVNNLRHGRADPNKWVYVAGFVLATVITLASSAELYVIITHFLTDG